MKDRHVDYAADTTPAPAGPLLAPNRTGRRLGHVNAVDWSSCALAQRFGISGETKGGPGVTWDRNYRRRAA